MPREDYRKLIRLPQSKWPEGYFLQSPYSDKNSRFVFAKLRKNGTACITPNHAHIKMHHGIFVDIFPLDETRFNGWSFWWIPRFFDRLCCVLLRKTAEGGACGCAEGLDVDSPAVFLCSHREPLGTVALRKVWSVD